MESYWYGLRDWVKDTTDPSIQESPFLVRTWQTSLLLLTNLLRCTGDMWYAWQCYSKRACRHTSAVLGLSSFAVLVWSLVLLMDSKSRQARCLAVEVVVALNVMLEVFYLSHEYSSQLLFYLLLCIAFFFLLKVHPFPVLLLILEFITLLHLPSWLGAKHVESIWPHGQHIFPEAWQVKAMPTLWLLGAWSWYLHSLLRKVHAVKAGLIVEKAVGLNRQWVPERAVTEAPIMARSAAWAYASAGCLWLGHLICLDVLSGHGCIPELWLQSHVYVSIIGLGTSLLLCGAGLVLLQSSTISAVWCKDLPLALFSCTPLILNTIFSCILPGTCPASDLLLLSLPQPLAAATTLCLASTHPLPMGLASTILSTVWVWHRPHGEVEVGASVVLALAHFSCHSLDYAYAALEIWERARESSEKTDLEMSHMDWSSSDLGNAQSCIGALPTFRKSAEVPQVRDIIAPEDLQEVRARADSSCSPLVDAFRPAVAVVRHGEREDAVWNSGWYESEDGRKHPYDCPITAEGVQQARDVAANLKTLNFGIVVSSPYLRCVQTAVVIAQQLGLMVLLDHELGEVFGRSVFSDIGAFKAGAVVPWRSRRRLYDTMKDWSPENWPGSKTPVEHVCWKRILGKPPAVGESLSEARTRYARRFLTYLARSRRAEKNLVVVSHGHMMEACLKVLPSTSSQRVTSVPYCGGFVAQLCPSAPTDPDPTLGANDVSDKTADSESFVSDKSKSSMATEQNLSEQLDTAKLAWWDVRLFGIDLNPSSSSDSSRRKFLTQLQDGTLSWDDIQKLLGELPETVAPSGRKARSNSCGTDITTTTTATDASMFLFRRPSFSGSVAFSDVSEEPSAPLRGESVEKAKPISLQSNPLLSRRNKLGVQLQETVHEAPTESSLRRSMPGTDDSAAISQSSLMSRRQKGRPLGLGLQVNGDATRHIRFQEEERKGEEFHTTSPAEG